MKLTNPLVLVFYSLFLWQSAYASIAGIVSYSKGDVIKILPDKKTFSGRITTIKNNDIIETAQNAKAVVLLNDGSQLIIYEKSSVLFNLDHPKKISHLNLLSGSIWCVKKPSDYTLQLSNLGNKLVTEQATFRVISNNSLDESNVYVSTEFMMLLRSIKPQKLSSSKKFRLSKGAVKTSLELNPGILLSSELNQYYIPESGKVPIQIHAQLNPDYYSDQTAQKYGMLISDSTNLVFNNPELYFSQDAIDFNMTTIAEGNHAVYVVMDNSSFVDGTNGFLQLKVHAMSKMKVLSIKTSRGNIKIKLVPKTTE